MVETVPERAAALSVAVGAGVLPQAHRAAIIPTAIRPHRIFFAFFILFKFSFFSFMTSVYAPKYRPRRVNF